MPEPNFEELLCPSCGTVTPHDLPNGICLKCLVRLGVGDVELEARSTDPLIRDHDLLDEIGRGASGVVYRARQRRLDRLVAIKILKNSRLLPPNELDRFRFEAKAVARMAHPNIVAIHDFGDSDGHPWYSMQLVEGVDMGKILNESSLQPERAGRLIAGIASAVEHAHRKGILHRDLKPSNVLLDADDEPHVTDFGLAFPLSQANNDEVLQRAGTASYMAPEQAKPGTEPLGPATDVWALGAMLFHALTGRPPFLGANLQETLSHVVSVEPIRPRLMNPSIPVDLETICLKCLSKRQSQRYASPKDVADELIRFRDGQPILARPETPGRRLWRLARRHPVSATLIGMLLLAMFGWIYSADRARRLALASSHHAEVAREALQHQLARQFLNRGSEALAQNEPAAALPWLAAAWKADSPAAEQVHSARFAATLQASPQLAALWKFPGSGAAVAVSADGEFAAGAANDGTVVVWETKSPDHSIKWSEMMSVAKIEFSQSPKGIYLALSPDVPDAEAKQSLLRFRESPFVHSSWDFPIPDRIRSLDLSATGRHLVVATSAGKVLVFETLGNTLVATRSLHKAVAKARFLARSDEVIVTSSFDGTARLWNWRTSQETAVLRHDGYVRDAISSSDGKLVATAGDDGAARVWDVFSGKPICQPLRHSSRIYSVAFSPDSSLVATASSDSTARIWDVQTGLPRTSPLKANGRLSQAAFSPNGSRLLCASSDGEVLVWNTQTGAREFSLQQAGNISGAEWLPDSSGIVTMGYEGLARQWRFPRQTPWIAELSVSGSPNAFVIHPRKNLIAIGLDDGQAILWNWEHPNQTVTLPHSTDVIRLGFSESGERLYSITRSGELQIWNPDTAERILQIPRTGVKAAQFQSDGSEIAAGGSYGSIYFWSLSRQEGRALPTPPGRVVQLGYGPNRRFLAATIATPRTIQSAPATWSLQLYEGNPWRIAARSTPFPGEAESFALSPSGRSIAVASTAQQTVVLDTETARILHTLEQPQEVKSVQFSPDGKYILTAGALGTVRLWEAQTGRTVTGVLSQSGSARARFSRDGRWVITSGRDLLAQVWDVSTLSPALPPFVHDDEIFGADFSCDQRFAVTCGRDYRVRVWALGYPPISLRDADRSSRLISARAVNDSGDIVALTSGELWELWQNHGARKDPAK